eukprot:jgi/Mesvir1/28052/Mv04653-RA.1
MRRNVSFFGPPLGSTIAADSVGKLPLVEHSRGCQCVFCRLSVRVVLDYPLAFPYLSDEDGRDGVRRAFGVTRLPDDTAVRGPPGSQECRYSIVSALLWMAGQEERDLEWRREVFLRPGERTCEDLEIDFVEAFAPLDTPPCVRHRPPADSRVPVNAASAALAITLPPAPDSPTTPPGFEVLPPHQFQPDASSRSDGPTATQGPPQAMDGIEPAPAPHVSCAVPYQAHVPHPPLGAHARRRGSRVDAPRACDGPAANRRAVRTCPWWIGVNATAPRWAPSGAGATSRRGGPAAAWFLDQPHEGVIVQPVQATMQAPAGQRGPQQEMARGHSGILPDFTPQPPSGYVLSHLDFLEPYTVQPVIYNYPRPAATPAPGPGMVFPRDLFLPPTGAIQAIYPSGLRRYVGVRWAANRVVPANRLPHPDPAHVPAPPRDPTSLVFDGQFWPKHRLYEAGVSERPHVPVQHPMLSPTYGLALVEALTPDLCASARAGQLRLLVHEGALRDLITARYDDHVPERLQVRLC